MIFQSTLPSQGATWGAWTGTYDTQTFQSTLPSQGATFGSPPVLWYLIFQSTLPSQGATSNGNSRGVVVGFQSTLPSQGATVRQWFLRRRPRDFNPRSPHRERRLASRNFKKLCNFNPRSPHRERRLATSTAYQMEYFNPRSPHRERPPQSLHFQSYTKFQSTLPSQGATGMKCKWCGAEVISIHAPLTGSDVFPSPSTSTIRYFNPRSPHRERRD